MPFLRQDDYLPPLLFRNTYVNTIYPSLFRQVPDLHYQRERIDTPDGDFLDLDWATQRSGISSSLCCMAWKARQNAATSKG